MVRKLIVSMFVLALVWFGTSACNEGTGGRNRNPDPRVKQNAGQPASAEELAKVRDDEDRASRIKTARHDFGLDRLVVESASNPKSSERKQEDVLCDGYLGYLDVRNGLLSARGDRSDNAFTAADWAKVGTTEELMQARQTEQALSFLQQLGSIVVLSANQREALEKSWGHTCDGMLEPVELNRLLKTATDMVEDAKLDAATVDSGLKRAVVASYRDRIAKAEEQEKHPGTEEIENYTVLLEDAQVWANLAELNVPARFAEKHKPEGR